MGLEIDFFYTPEFVTWDYKASWEQVRASYPAPTVTVTIAHDPRRVGDVVIVGTNPAYMRARAGHHRSLRHFVVIPDERHASRLSAVFQWTPTGLSLEVHGTNPIHLRSWGSTQTRSVSRVNEQTPGVLEGLDARVVGRFPGEGVWFRTRPSAGFSPVQAPRDEDVTPLDGELPHPALLRDLFYCPSYPRNVEHMRLGPESCPDPGHVLRRKRLAIVVAYYLRWLSWPPQGWHLPPDEGQHMVPRYAFTGETRVPTLPRQEIISALFDDAALAVSEETLLDTLVNAGLLSWDRVKDLVLYMQEQAPVDWHKAPRSHRHIVPLGVQHSISSFTLEPAPRG